MDLSAIALNCSLKKSPETSHTEALIRKVLGYMEPLGVSSHEIIRIADHTIPYGIAHDMGDGDEWPAIVERIRNADIVLLGTPIWMGVRSGVAQVVMERMNGSTTQTDPETGQFPFYNKVAGVIVTGNEDGAHAACETTLFNMSHFGFTIPANCDCYWVGDAGPGPSYLDGDGPKHEYTDKTARYTAHNCVHMARVLRRMPYPTNLNHLQEEAKEHAQSCSARRLNS